MKRGKIVSVDDTVRVIRDGDTVALDGFLGACVAEELIVGLTNRFRETGEPKNLTLIYASGIGDGKDRRVKTIVNYDNFSIVQELDVTRYTTSTFLRMKLGDELQRRDMAPHIFQSKEEARQALEKKE
jgi:acyl CoA:acetate/3-ketoacid CoA transferase